MGTKPRCWAEIAGGCGGHLEKEHPAGRKNGLFLNEIQILGFHAELENEPVPVERIYRNILCADHNRYFSREVDPAAHEAYRAIRDWFFDDGDGSGESGPLWTPTSTTVDGYAFGRWLCKYYCNWIAMMGGKPNPGYIRWAVSGTGQRPWFYWRKPDAAKDFGFRRRILCTEHVIGYPGNIETHVFRVLFMGLEFLVTPVLLAEIEEFLRASDADAFDALWSPDVLSIRRPTVAGVAANTAFVNFTSWDHPVRED